jgi:hypothetical protein
MSVADLRLAALELLPLDATRREEALTTLDDHLAALAALTQPRAGPSFSAMSVRIWT